MSCSVVVLYKRRSDIPPGEFQRYMEDVHIPLMKQALGDHFPSSYPRRYVARVESGAGDRLGVSGASRKHGNPTAPVVLVGSPDEWAWDMMGEMMFRDELHMQQCYAMMNGLEGQRVKDDEENFTETEQLRVVLVGRSIAA